MVCRETLGSGIHEDVTPAYTTHLQNYCRSCTLSDSNGTPTAGLWDEMRMFFQFNSIQYPLFKQVKHKRYTEQLQQIRKHK